MLRNTVVTSYADSDMVVDLGGTDCRNQTYQSVLGTRNLQTLLLSSHKGQQNDRLPALPLCSYSVLVHCPHCIRCRCRFFRSRAGRAFHQDRTGRLWVQTHAIRRSSGSPRYHIFYRLLYIIIVTYSCTRKSLKTLFILRSSLKQFDNRK